MAGERPLEVGTIVTYSTFISYSEGNDVLEDKIGIVIDNADDSYTIFTNSESEEISIDFVTTVVGINEETIKIANKIIENLKN